MQENLEEKYFIQQENSALSHKITKETLEEEFKAYVKESNVKILNKLTTKECDILESLITSTKGAYFVKGSRKSLKRFRAYFIAKCLFNKPRYATFMLKEYIEGLSEKNDDETFISGSEKELLFLHLHGEASGTGGTDNWIALATIDRVANRKRKGLTTVILSERDFPLMEGSKEFKVIDLGGSRKAINTEAAIQRVNNSKDSGETRPSYK